MSASREFTLAPLPTRTWVLLGVVVLATTACLLWSFHGIAGTPQRWLMPTAIVVGVLALLASIQRRGIALRDGMLLVRASLYTRKVPVPALRLDEARILDLDEHTEFRPVLKTNGYSLPGFHAGNFRLRNRERAFCLVIGDGRVLWLPRHDGAQSLLLSPERPQALLEALRAAQA